MLAVLSPTSFMESLSRRQSTMFWCQDLEQDGLSKWNNLLRVISVRRCPERCDATRSTCVSRGTKSSVSKHTWQDCRVWCESRLVAMLRVAPKSSQCFSPTVRIARSARPSLAELCRGHLIKAVCTAQKQRVGFTTSPTYKDPS